MYWYEDEIKRLEKERKLLDYKPATLFYGSSSIRLWDTMLSDFKVFLPVNLGFGGSTLAACTWFFDRTVAPYEAERIVIYAGDNDLGDGRHPEEIFIFFQHLATRIDQHFGTIPCYFISIKPSFSRWNIIESLKYTNNLIQNEIIRRDANWEFIDILHPMLDANGYPQKKYFETDGLHLSKQGYTLWKHEITAKLLKNVHTGLTLR